MSKESRRTNLEIARAYVLKHPDQSKALQSVNTGLSERTIANARAELISEGLLPQSRKGFKPSVAPTSATPAPQETLRDHQAMQKLADMINAPDLDEGEIIRRFLKQCISFSFDTSLHADTRMSASQMWAKLRDATKSHDLGPGKPKTRAEAIERLKNLLIAVGPDITIAAVNLAFTVKEPADEGQVPADNAEAPRGPAGTPETPLGDPNLRSDDRSTGSEPLG